MTSTRLLYCYLAGMAAVIGSYVWAPDQPWVQAAWQTGVGWLAAGFVLIGYRRYRPPGGSAWLLFAAGAFLNSSGILVEQVLITLQGKEAAENFPTVSDAFWLGLYPCMVIGMFMINRRRSPSRDWSVMLDSTTITTGLGLLSWVFVIRPAEGDPSLSVLGHAVVAAYPVGDLVVLAMVVRMLLGGAGKITAIRYLLAAMCTFLVSDIAWLVWYDPTGLPMHLIQMLALIAYALVGAGALHPSAREIGVPTESADVRLGPALLIGLAAAALIAPTLLLVQGIGGEVRDVVAIAVSSTVLFLLVVTRMAGLLRRVEAQSRQLRDLSRVDPLTSLPNRRAWATELPLAVDRARRSGAPLTVAMIDLDYFKRFNDTFGHPAGDQLLKTAAAAWRENLRTTDVLARYGGEEFAVLLPDADAERAMQVLDRLRPATPAGQTFSAGVATWDGDETGDQALARADAALYQAKLAGRNQTAAAVAPDLAPVEA
jgi:diguanylate cyclase (GGDEF)-like protein